MITPTEFKTGFPEFSTELDARIQIFIDEAEIVLNEEYWGTKYDLGAYYYTAHLLAMANGATAAGGSGGGSGGPVSGKSVDGVSVSYATGSTGGGGSSGSVWLTSTSYGQRYLELMNNLGVPACSI